jgi:hypothetical protein
MGCSCRGAPAHSARPPAPSEQSASPALHAVRPLPGRRAGPQPNGHRCRPMWPTISSLPWPWNNGADRGYQKMRGARQGHCPFVRSALNLAVHLLLLVPALLGGPTLFTPLPYLDLHPVVAWYCLGAFNKHREVCYRGLVENISSFLLIAYALPFSCHFLWDSSRCPDILGKMRCGQYNKPLHIYYILMCSSFHD